MVYPWRRGRGGAQSWQARPNKRLPTSFFIHLQIQILKQSAHSFCCKVGKSSILLGLKRSCFFLGACSRSCSSFPSSSKLFLRLCLSVRRSSRGPLSLRRLSVSGWSLVKRAPISSSSSSSSMLMPSSSLCQFNLFLLIASSYLAMSSGNSATASLSLSWVSP